MIITQFGLEREVDRWIVCHDGVCSKKGSTRCKVPWVRDDIFNYGGHITKNKMERPSLTGDCTWQASFPAEEQPYSSDLLSRRNMLSLLSSITPHCSSLNRRCWFSHNCVHLPSYLTSFPSHPCFMANLINDCSKNDHCAGILQVRIVLLYL